MGDVVVRETRPGLVSPFEDSVASQADWQTGWGRKLGNVEGMWMKECIYRFCPGGARSQRQRNFPILSPRTRPSQCGTSLTTATLPNDVKQGGRRRREGGREGWENQSVYEIHHWTSGAPGAASRVSGAPAGAPEEMFTRKAQQANQPQAGGSNWSVAFAAHTSRLQPVVCRRQEIRGIHLPVPRERVASRTSRKPTSGAEAASKSMRRPNPAESNTNEILTKGH